ncbi:hypothetical protein, partial [Sulfurimonas sp.]|uniref:hypothetical protein n=1 Tax=Sulfurimonas sp. TaxID=2022749 RepID=UPI0019F44262
FESYCSGTDCVKTLLPNGVASKNTDDLRWFINDKHNSTNDGIIGTVTQKDATPANPTDDIVTASPVEYSVTWKPTTDLTYNESKGYPYRTTMNNDASPWLIYNEDVPTATRNEFQVEFDNIGVWTGENETDTTTTTPEGATTNRRIMW